MRPPKPRYLYVRFKFDKFQAEHADSLAALPGVIETRPTYPDDPALYNLYLVVAEADHADGLIQTVRDFDLVDFVEFGEKPEPR